MGLRYGAIAFDGYFQDFCKTLLSYYYVSKMPERKDALIEWLYSHSVGILSVVVSLVHDAQEIAILNGRERLDIEALTEAYQKRMGMLHGYISPQKCKHSATTADRAPVIQTITEKIENSHLISDFVNRAKAEQIDVVALLREHFTVDEVVL